jgi:DNA-binding protein Fis
MFGETMPHRDAPLEELPLAETVRRKLRALLDRLGVHRAPHLHKRVMDEVERVLIEEALRQAKGSKKDAAAILGVHRNSLRLRMRCLKIAEPKE